MIATDFTRDDCQLGKKRVTYAKLQREYRCQLCDGRLGLKWNEDYPENWHVECLACKGKDFIHEREAQRQQAEATEVLDGLPPEIAKLLQPEQPKLPHHRPGIFPLNPKQVEI